MSGCSDVVEELPAARGPVAIKPMFGGAGVHAGHVIFGPTIDEVLYLTTKCTPSRKVRFEGSAITHVRSNPPP